MKPASSPRRRDSAAQLLDAASRILAERSVVEITLSEVATAAKLISFPQQGGAAAGIGAARCRAGFGPTAKPGGDAASA
jgi:hypothetical protein